MRQITTQQVKTALIQIAEQSKRPHYGSFVVREVRDAIQKNSYHNLKNLVLREIYIQYGDLYKPEPVVTEIQNKEAFFEKIVQVKNFYAGQKVLVRASGVSDRTISLLLRGKIELTVSVWEKIEPVIDKVLKELEEYEKEKEKQKHGKYVTYRKGCRCMACRVAWREYIKGSNVRKKLMAEQEQRKSA
jgi:hypothetical protein